MTQTIHQSNQIGAIVTLLCETQRKLTHIRAAYDLKQIESNEFMHKIIILIIIM